MRRLTDTDKIHSAGNVTVDDVCRYIDNLAEGVKARARAGENLEISEDFGYRANPDDPEGILGLPLIYDMRTVTICLKGPQP